MVSLRAMQFVEVFGNEQYGRTFIAVGDEQPLDGTA